LVGQPDFLEHETRNRKINAVPVRKILFFMGVFI
jgi:hypothetical protein